MAFTLTACNSRHETSLFEIRSDYIIHDGEILGGRFFRDYGLFNITIADGATITLKYVDMRNCQGINCEGDATIILEGVNCIHSQLDTPAIQPGGEGTTLTIMGDGDLTAIGGTNSPGIGSSANGTCGDIVISGGTVRAVGGSHAAGIGCGFQGKCGAIIIKQTVTKVTVEKGEDATYSIGRSDALDKCGIIIIGGVIYNQIDVLQYYDSINLAESPFVYPYPYY